MSPPDQDDLDSVAKTVRSPSRDIAVSDAVTLLESTDPENRKTVTHLLGTVVKQDPSRAYEAIGSLVSLLDRSERDLRSEAVVAIGRIGTEVPPSLDPAVEPLIERLYDDAPAVRLDAVTVLSEAAKTYPAATATAVPRLSELLASDLPAIRVQTTNVLRTLAEEIPESVSPVTSALLDAVESQLDDESGVIDAQLANEIEHHMRRFEVDTRELRTTLRRDVAATLVAVAEDDPRRVVATIPRIIDVARRETDTTAVLSWLTLFGFTAERHPKAVRSAVGFLIECLRKAEDDSIIGKAVWVCSLVADTAPEAISDELRTVLPTIIESLEATPQAQVPAVSLLAYMAEHYPEEVKPARPVLEDLLDSEYPAARTGAALTLGFVGEDSVLSELECLHEEDTHPNVKHAAAKSIELIRERHTD